MAISAGDAVMRFLGDTTQLDLAVDKVNAETPQKLIPVKDSLTGLATLWGEVGDAALKAGEDGEIAGNQLAEGAEKAAYNAREAKGELALLGEETGVKLPRHVRGFVTELPGVGAALEAAFSATAILILIQVIVEATEKLTEFISDHFIYTEAMKETEKQIAANNTVLIEYKKQLDDANEALKRFGKEGSALTQISLDELNKKITDSQQAFKDAGDDLYLYRNGLKDMSEEEVKTAQQTYGNSFRALQSFYAQRDALTLQQQSQEQQEYTHHQETLINIQKTTGQALIDLRVQQQLNLLDRTKPVYFEEAAIKAAAEQQKYILEQNALQQRLSLLKQEGDKTLDQQREIEAKLRENQIAHEAQALANIRQFGDSVRSALKASLSQTSVSELLDNEIVTPVTKAFKDAGDAANALGFEFSGALVDQLQVAQEAFEKLRTSGVAKTTDLLQAQIAVLRAQIPTYAGNTAAIKETQKQIDDLTKSYLKLMGVQTESQTHFQRLNTLMKVYDQDVKQAGDQTKFFADLGSSSIEAFANAAGSGFDSFLKHQASFGEAMKEATASVLDSIASQAFANALYFTAWGIADTFWNPARAGADFAAAAEFGAIAAIAGAAGYALGSGGSTSTGGGGSNAPAGSGPVQTSPTQSVTTGPNARNNVQKFGNGALISGPTMAMLGDSATTSTGQEEAAIPLDNPEAVRKIVEALGGGMGGGIHVHVKGMISADNLGKVVNNINKKVKGRQLTLASSHSYRINRRSQ